MSRQPDLMFRLAGACFAIGGLATMSFGLVESLRRSGALDPPYVMTVAEVAAVGPAGDLDVRFQTQDGIDIRSDGGGLLSPPWFQSPYGEGDQIAVAYSTAQPADAYIVDRREWIRIGLLFAIGLMILTWGGAIYRFGLWGALGGVAAWVVLRPFGEAGMAALLNL